MNTAKYIVLIALIAGSAAMGGGIEEKASIAKVAANVGQMVAAGEQVVAERASYEAKQNQNEEEAKKKEEEAKAYEEQAKAFQSAADEAQRVYDAVTDNGRIRQIAARNITEKLPESFQKTATNFLTKNDTGKEITAQIASGKKAYQKYSEQVIDLSVADTE